MSQAAQFLWESSELKLCLKECCNEFGDNVQQPHTPFVLVQIQALPHPNHTQRAIARHTLLPPTRNFEVL